MRDYAVIFGNDHPDESRALQLCTSVAPYVDAIKIEFYPEQFIKQVKKNLPYIPIIVDAKLSHIGHLNKDNNTYDGTMSKRVTRLAESGADFIIIQLFPGPESIREAVDTANRYGVKILGLGPMTHKGGDILYEHPLDKKHTIDRLHQFGITSLDTRINEECSTIWEYLVVLADACNVHGFIVPANIPRIRNRMRQLSQKPMLGTGHGRQWYKPEMPLKEQMKETFSVLGNNSGAIFATEIWRAEDPIKSAQNIRNWRDELVSKLNQ